MQTPGPKTTGSQGLRLYVVSGLGFLPGYDCESVLKLEVGCTLRYTAIRGPALVLS
jgi:hypothetical protein